MIAIVDDEEIIGTILTEVLMAEGYPARAFRSAQDCLAAVAAGLRLDLCFVDLRMRGCSGAQFVQRLRQSPRVVDVAIYVVSGSMLEADFPPRHLIEGTITKPFSLEQVLLVAARHLRPVARQDVVS